MKAACSSQPSCSRIGREGSQPGPCTSLTAKLAMAGAYRPLLTFSRAAALGLGPARRAAHVRDAQAALPGAGPAHVLIDQLRRLAGRGHPARLTDQFRHARQYCAAWV